MKLSRELLPFIFQEDIYAQRSHFLFLIPRPWNDLSSSAQQTILNLLKAIRLSPDDVTLLYHREVQPETLSIFRPRFILGLGVTVAGFQERYVRHTLHQAPLILADEVENLDKERKTQLWNVLKTELRI